VIFLETTIISQTHNKVIGRKEIKADVVYVDVHPKRQEIRESIAKAINAEPANVIVSRIRNNFGLRKSRIDANVYDSPDDVKKYELRYKLVRAGIMEKKKKVEKAPKAAPKKGGIK
jgi:small subunit ribosomal protein S24e